MKKTTILVLLGCAAVGFGVWKVSTSQNNSDLTATKTATNDQSSSVKPITPAAPNSVQDVNPALLDTISNAELLRIKRKNGKPSIGFSNKHVVNELYNEVWLDPKSSVSRRRIRFIKTDFKYPNLRLDEIVTTDPETGQVSIQTVKNSVADHLTVGLKKNGNPAAAAKELEALGYTVRKQSQTFVLVELEDFTDPESQDRNIKLINQSSELADFVETDNLRYLSRTPNDPRYPEMFGLNNTGQDGGIPGQDINAPQGWDERTDASNIVVAVIDSGINYLHEDLIANLWKHPDTGIFGIDQVDDDTDPNDENGHGTHVSGTIGAVGNNGKGITGVAWNTQIMTLRGFDADGAATSDLAPLIDYARENGANLMNGSYGGPAASQLARNAITACSDANIAFIVAAGNDATDNDAVPQYPSSYDIPNIVSVASTDRNGDLSDFSNFGANTVDIAAPGTEILSCWIGGPSEYNIINGTSMATPHVCGAMALAYAQYPGLGVGELIGRLFVSVDDEPNFNGIVHTSGKLNLNTLLTGDFSLQNDDFVDAFQGNERRHVYRLYNLREASRESDEDGFSQPDTGTHSAWVTWTAPSSGSGYIEASADQLPLRFVIYKNGDRDNLVEVYDSITESSINPKREFQKGFVFTEGEKYTILVDTDNSGSGLNPVTITIVAKPENNDISNAYEFIGSNFSGSANNTNGTLQHFEIEGSRNGDGIAHGGGRGNSIWWKWTAPFDGDITFSAAGAGFDVTTAVYTGWPIINGGGTQGEWKAVSAKSTAGATKTVTVVKGRIYYIAVDGNDTGEITLSGAASVTTLATNIAGNGSVSTTNGTNTYFTGQTAQLTATPATGWTFAGWIGSDTNVGTTANAAMSTDRTVTARFTQSLADWKTANLVGQTTLTADSDDPDSDGVSNLQEYLHGSNPTDPASTGIISSQSDSDCICITYTRSQGIQSPYAIGSEASLDMSNWSTDNIVEEIVSTQNGIETVNAKLPLSAGANGFIRVKYTAP